jgi:hypothetical protein
MNKRIKYDYRSMKANIFFVYKIDKSQIILILFAFPKKAILNSLYLNHQIKTTKHIEGF